jgi:peptidyl-prolyl cis-trans isomerase D
MNENMADKMKRKLSAKSITAIILFGAIILVFVFFGLPGKMGASVGSVARVNNTLISIAELLHFESRHAEARVQI